MRAAETGSLPGPELARRIDHTLLKADARHDEFEKLATEARTHSFASVCVNSGRLPEVVSRLAGSPVLPIAVVGFPLGAMETEAKVAETRRALDLGAKEIDMVLAIGVLKDGAYEGVEKDVEAVVAAAKTRKIPVKVILETCLLTREEKIAACVIAKRAGAAFVKTSTGFAAAGATVEDIRLMRTVVGPDMGVKASGGIRTRADALKMIAEGADRIGASASVAIATAGISAESGGY
ncbi:MAG: deoxyribose-phosphate aldolase [Bdellovibrionales bacterium]|nr:deoxyribose-phosphate aldolase [Bdellovibrionales bacterium]